VPLPVWKKRNQDQMVVETKAMQNQAEAMVKDLEAMIMAEIEQSLADGKKLDRQISLLETASLPQARLAFDSASAAYRNGKADFMTLLDSQLAIHRLSLRLARMNSDYFITLARLDRLAGKPAEEIIKQLE